MTYSPQTVKLAFPVQMHVVKTVAIAFRRQLDHFVITTTGHPEESGLSSLAAAESYTSLSTYLTLCLGRKRRCHKSLVSSNTVAACFSRKEHGKEPLIQKSSAMCYLSLDRNGDQNWRPWEDIGHSNFMKIQALFSCSLASCPIDPHQTRYPRNGRPTGLQAEPGRML